MPDECCPFPDPSTLDDDGLACVNVTLASFADDARRMFGAHPNPVTKWLLEREELALDHVAKLVANRVAHARDEGELEIDIRDN